VPVHLRLALLALLLVFAAGSAGAEPASPTAAGSAVAIRIVVPGRPDVTSAIVSATGSATGGAFTYPAGGSILAAATTTASVLTGVAKNAAARAESDATTLSLFGGELTADGVTARASAGTGPSGAGGNQVGSVVSNLVVLGRPMAGTEEALGDWGTLAVNATVIDRTAAAGAKAYRGKVVELDVKLTAAHGGLPAGSEIQVGFAEASVQTFPAGGSQPTTTTSPSDTLPNHPPAGKPPQTGSTRKRPPRIPLRAQPELSAGPYLFPVFGSTSYVDTFGVRGGTAVKYHHGDDIFGTLGQPVVAVTAGTIFAVGWDTTAGNRLSLLDSQGNQFSYSRLSAFTTAARNGAHVRTGEVIGFMGNTGGVEPSPVHLHFEIHPVSFLYLGANGAVDPTQYLDAWRHQQDLPYPIAPAWAPNVLGARAGPEPGAFLLGMSDISSADGLDPGSLERALVPPRITGVLRGP
jgi:murein DD-endopeptidase MepM/ murein hydrolase activator NlpD